MQADVFDAPVMMICTKSEGSKCSPMTCSEQATTRTIGRFCTRMRGASFLKTQKCETVGEKKYMLFPTKSFKQIRINDDTCDKIQNRPLMLM